MSFKETEEKIRKAFEVDRILPKVAPAKWGNVLGKYIQIPDDFRKYEDIYEDFNNSVSSIAKEDLKLWYDVMTAIARLEERQRAVVKFRGFGMGWGTVAKKMRERGISYHYLSRTTLWRYYSDALKNLEKMV